MENFYSIIFDYQNLNKNISHSFWQTCIEGYFKIKSFTLSANLIKIYPIKYSYSESLWKNIILSNMNDDDILKVFNIFLEKFDNRVSSDDFKAFENIFNIFVEEFANN